ncbi:divergent polysaccharide deacetylase family protein [Thermoanaerobaculum aquaticum]|uniref:divergent polysaccharide deacetylase family protein n=1 Tax=Thermoanaerobaculum aquaticum TaxID=1312852 RepID=UPI0013783EEE|nr:divergent polysaccharide deacetylase family protein [Thermoanaerobaculum aquaticum]
MRQGDDASRLEHAVRQVLARVGAEAATLSWETGQDALPTLAVQISPEGKFSLQRLTLELEAAFHNLGGELKALPVLEAGGYGRAAFQGLLGRARLRLVVLREAAPPPPAKPKPKGDKPGKLAVILDDAGYSEAAVASLATLPPQVAVAVLPNAPASAAVAEALRAQGRELLLHMPMEPEGNGANPGDDALVVGLEPGEVRARLERALAVVGPVAGVNNHMGSRATSDAELMRHFMKALAGRGLYFLDSRTTPASVAASLAREAGIRTLRRDVFLDVVEDEGAVRSALATAASLARSKGQAVAIGHVHPLTLRVLHEELSRLSGVTLVRPSALAH